MSDRKPIEAPERIYLQWYPTYDGSESDCTWCSDKIDDNDTEYIRADKYAELKKNLEIAVRLITDGRSAYIEDCDLDIAWEKEAGILKGE